MIQFIDLIDVENKTDRESVLTNRNFPVRYSWIYAERYSRICLFQLAWMISWEMEHVYNIQLSQTFSVCKADHFDYKNIKDFVMN